MNWLRGGSETAAFDGYEEFVPERLPTPGAFLDGHVVLSGGAHIAVHERARDRFETHGVYDVTFGYNLARLNLDHRHPDAGFRYAIEADDPSVLRAEFTPTTEFCPQADTLTVGAFRAWNGGDGTNTSGDDGARMDREDGGGTSRREDGGGTSRREDGGGTSRREDGGGTSRREDGGGTSRREDAAGAYRLVRVRVARSHHSSEATNERLRRLEARFLRTGEVDPDGVDTDDGSTEGGTNVFEGTG